MSTLTLGANSVLRYRSLVWNFAQRDLKSRFKGTWVGWGWSLLVPLATLAIYSLLNREILHGKPPLFGNGHKGNFPVYLFIGLTVWGFFSNGINTAIASLLSTGQLLRKIYFPSWAAVIGTMVAVAIQSAIEVGLVLAVLVVFVNAGASWLLAVPLAILLFLFAAGVSYMCAIANIYFRDFAHIISVFLQLLFYATPILYTADRIPSLTIRHVIEANPVAVFVELFRDVLYKLQVGPLTDWAYAVGCTVVSLALGAFVYYRSGRDLGEHV